MKYDKHIIRKPFHKAPAEFGDGIILKHTNDDNAGIICEYHIIDAPDWSIGTSRIGDTHELLCFLGGDPQNIRDLGAEVRIILGDDNEEHIINDAAIVSIPPGLKHGPISVVRFSRPFVLLRISNSKEYQSRLDSKGDEGLRQ